MLCQVQSILRKYCQGIVLLMIVELETRRVIWRNLCPGGARYLRPVGHSTVKDDQEEVIRYSTVQYSTVQYSTVQYSTVQYSTVQYSTV